ncbi:MAG TPA: alpha/beta fold hydrolase [Polyangiaceae bacterium]|jgi:pimeloyl-ACP methyl ester carboxylesterase|nr:alpha/beta fold hydrolase [Polyangiaceae bacterium]
MQALFLDVREQFVRTDDGWSLRLRRTVSPTHLPKSNAHQLLIVPGYGMNSFIFSYHPRGTSLERFLAESGFEVWTMDLRGQGESRPYRRKAGALSLESYALHDVPACIHAVLARTGAPKLTLIGCSLGGSIAYAYLALCGVDRVDALVAMGAPLRWAEIHPLVRAMFSSPALVGSVRVSNTRRLMRSLMPVLVRAPALLSFYMNPSTIDLSCAHELTRTVEDPHPAINRDIAVWLKRRDLEIKGVNVTEALRGVKLPLMVVLSNKDGIVPERTALTVLDTWGSDDIEVLRVGDERNWYAHANLFVADDAPRLVFDPLVRWLRTHQDQNRP